MTTTADLRAILDAADSVPGLQSRYGAAIDDLTAAQRDLATATADATTARADRDAAQAEALRLGSDLTAARATVQTLTEVVAARDATIAELRAQFAEGEPEPVGTLWGACTFKGGVGPASIKAALDKWGDPLALRLFCAEDDGWLLPTIPDGVPLVMITWKPPIDELLAGEHDAAIGRAAAWGLELLRRGIIVVFGVWHEGDVKTRQGKGARDNFAAAHTYFDAKMKALAPAILTSVTVSAWTFNGVVDPEPWALAGDLFVVDLDGLNSTKAYPDYSDEISRIAAFAERHGYLGWAAGEVGEPRLSSDTDGSKRAAWLTTLAAQIEGAGAMFALLFDYTRTASVPYELTTPAEIAAWKAVIG